jgi:hypothetical protein
MFAIPAIELDHVGIAGRGPDSVLSAALGGLAGSREMPSGVEIGRFGPDSDLELVWPKREANPIAGFLAKRGPGLHHVALRVDVALERLIPELAEGGLRTTGPVEPSGDGRPSVFLHPADAGGVLVELVQGARR